MPSNFETRLYLRCLAKLRTPEVLQGRDYILVEGFEVVPVGSLGQSADRGRTSSSEARIWHARKV